MMRATSPSPAASPGACSHKLVANPALFLPPMLMPIFFFVAFAGGLSAVDQAPGFDYPAGYTTFMFGFVLLPGRGLRRRLHRLLDRRRLPVRASAGGCCWRRPTARALIVGYGDRRD